MMEFLSRRISYTLEIYIYGKKLIHWEFPEKAFFKTLFQRISNDVKTKQNKNTHQKGYVSVW